MVPPPQLPTPVTLLLIAVGEIEGATTTAGGANQLDDDAAGNTSPAPELIEEQGNQARVRDLQQYGIFNRRAYGISRQ